MSLTRRIIFGCYNLIKTFSTSDTQIYDIDPSMAEVETVSLKPLDHTEEQLRELKRHSDEELQVK
jgi:KUP system potassium uptake protein